ncbi:unnamed protein product, partial [Anisakis simplex]|uniref:TACC_C domain-containing protein n=1 Tax=Anisakis simplex TaxID=6269 RepID=A0A0M3J828_ANISI
MHHQFCSLVQQAAEQNNREQQTQGQKAGSEDLSLQRSALSPKPRPRLSISAAESVRANVGREVSQLDGKSSDADSHSTAVKRSLSSTSNPNLLSFPSVREKSAILSDTSTLRMAVDSRQDVANTAERSGREETVGSSTENQKQESASCGIEDPKCTLLSSTVLDNRQIPPMADGSPVTVREQIADNTAFGSSVQSSKIPFGSQNKDTKPLTPLTDRRFSEPITRRNIPDYEILREQIDQFDKTTIMQQESAVEKNRQATSEVKHDCLDSSSPSGSRVTTSKSMQPSEICSPEKMDVLVSTAKYEGPLCALSRTPEVEESHQAPANSGKCSNDVSESALGGSVLGCRTIQSEPSENLRAEELNSNNFLKNSVEQTAPIDERRDSASMQSVESSQIAATCTTISNASNDVCNQSTSPTTKYVPVTDNFIMPFVYDVPKSTETQLEQVRSVCENDQELETTTAILEAASPRRTNESTG